MNLQGLAAVRPQAMAIVLWSYFRCLHTAMEIPATAPVSFRLGSFDYFRYLHLHLHLLFLTHSQPALDADKRWIWLTV